MSQADIVWAVRTFVYQHFAAAASSPTVGDIAEAFGINIGEADFLLRELDRLLENS